MTDGSEKRPGQRDRILALLSDGRWHPVKEVHDVGGFRYSARVHELRALGYEIERRPLGGGLHEYRLVVTAQRVLEL